MTEDLAILQRRRRWFRPLDGAILLVMLAMLVPIGIALCPLVLLTRAYWRYRAHRRASDKPHSLLILGYNTYDEAVTKGIMDDPNLWYNCGERFEKVFVYVALAEKTSQRRITDRIRYRQDGDILPGLQIPFAWTLLALRYVRGWWRACFLALSADVILVNGPNRSAQIGLVAKLVMGTPAVVFIEAFWEKMLPQQSYIPERLRWAVLLWYRLVYRVFDAYCGTASFAADYYAKLGMNVDGIFPYVNNVDVTALLMAARQSEIPIELQRRDHPWIVTVGRLHNEKKSKSVIDLQYRLAEMGLHATGVFVGEGPYRDELLCHSMDLGVQDCVLFLGQLPQPQGMAVAAASDFYFAPMQGNALIEAMAAGCCIVAYDNVEHRIYVDDRTAKLVPEGDVEAAARAIIELSKDPDQVRKLRSAARTVALQRYTPENIADVWFLPFLVIYQRALK
ncbi:glycosyltransferase family 4 protein [Bradyrhizobium sp. McL0615]|uniref:glycosyltransferase family 4 protein n=1 Tax=Bradyrhizobium sp. McL0615 TaxID=3415673 RepID=UPI003CF34BBC